MALAATLAWTPLARAHDPVPGTAGVDEQDHQIEISVAREGATLRVTRSMFNSGLLHAEVELPIPLPCAATLGDVKLRAPDQSGAASWVSAELLDEAEAARRWALALEGPADGAPTVLNADTAVHVTREDYACEAELSIYPIPPLHSRTVSYEVFMPSTYVEGRYLVELPSFDAYGRTATVELRGARDPALAVSVDGRALGSAGTTLDGASVHTIELAPHDRGRGQLSAVDLDLPGLVERAPAAAARLVASPDEPALGRVLLADFEAPSVLAQLPPVRRVVVLVDASRSLSDSSRRELTELAAAYLEQLAADPAQPTRTELVVFDRTPRRIYHDFVPAAWAAEDLAKLEIEVRNGSELGAAMSFARELLASPAAADGADWVIVLSDLYLRQDFSVDEQRAASAASSERIHILQASDNSSEGFGPAAADAPWLAVAREGGGMLWEVSSSSLGDEPARELISPTRVWSLTLALELRDGQRLEHPLGRWLGAGAARRYAEFRHPGAALERATLFGEVWGQRRAWTATPSEAAGRRAAGRLASDESDNPLSDAARAALAFYAEVVSPFTSAWAEASFDGSAPAQAPYIGGLGLHGVGSSFRCGGAGSFGRRGSSHRSALRTLAQTVIDSCAARRGSFEFETTDLEIVAVVSPNRCVEAKLWDLNLASTRSEGRKRLAITYADGTITDLVVR
ncbi:VWA domain containing CoxE-like protein [Enhygromyxa salina]|uniref:VWA domain containing CoxE-like protein n=1 Tax=Enhygromyxa salina TaxID=215803 RepID=A0A2S9XMD6_9BACT|nr:VWA domain containing CoxE-like protein [Enhygromyxa salina]